MTVPERKQEVKTLQIATVRAEHSDLAIRFGDLGRMPRRIIHPDKPLDRGWGNWIFAGWEAWRGHRAAYVMGLGRWPVAYLHCGQPWIYGILERRVWLRRLVEQLGQQFKTS